MLHDVRAAFRLNYLSSACQTGVADNTSLPQPAEADTFIRPPDQNTASHQLNFAESVPAGHVGLRDGSFLPRLPWGRDHDHLSGLEVPSQLCLAG